MAENLKLNGFNISKIDFEEKYSISLTDLEWGILKSKTESLWLDHIEELRNLALRHIKSSMNDIGYRIALEGKDIVFKKIKD